MVSPEKKPFITRVIGGLYGVKFTLCQVLMNPVTLDPMYLPVRYMDQVMHDGLGAVYITGFDIEDLENIRGHNVWQETASRDYPLSDFTTVQLGWYCLTPYSNELAKVWGKVK
jgi:hypothetical protein